MAFTASQGGDAQIAQVQVANSGGSDLPFTAVAVSSPGSWLSLSPAAGTTTLNTPVMLTATATVGALPPGTYTGTITITGAGTTTVIPVTLSVGPPTAVIVLSQSALSFTTVAQGGTPLPQSFGILNSGRGPMNWQATAATLSGGNWLQLSLAGGSVTRPYFDVSLVNVSINAVGLAAGTYYGRVQVVAVTDNSPQVLTVTLTVLPAGSTPPPEVRPTGLIFTGLPGVNPGSQDVTISNPKGTTDAFLSGSIGQGFAYLPTNADVPPNQPVTLRVFPDFSKLTAGNVAQGTITLQFSDGTPVTIRVLGVLAPSGTSGQAGKSFIAGASPTASCSSPLEIQFRSLQSGFVAFIGQATTVAVQVVDDCGNPAISGSAGVQATFTNGDDPLRLTHVGNGVWTGTWRPAHGTPGTVIISVTAFQVQGSTTRANQVALTGTLSTGSAAPLVTSGGVVHAASFVAGAPVAPGSLITVYGSNLADATGAAGGLPLPQELFGAQAKMGNKGLPVLFARKDQLNLQVPFDLAANTQFQITVQRDDLLSVPEQLVVAPAQPGIFTVNQQGTGQGIILKSDQITLAQPGSPASIGETILIYCTGLGTVAGVDTGRVAAGQPAPGPPEPLPSTLSTPIVTIGGKLAQVSYSGLTPGSVGLYQINAKVPEGVAPGDAVPVTVEMARQVSPPVTMAIR